jgi:hypothetical protein
MDANDYSLPRRATDLRSDESPQAPVTVEDLQIITDVDIEAAVRSVCSDNREMSAIAW